MMEHIPKEGLKDIGKVFGVNSFTYTWTKTQQTMDPILDMSTLVQEVGTSVLIVLTALYTLFKMVDMFRKMRWNKQDRINETSE